MQHTTIAAVRIRKTLAAALMATICIWLPSTPAGASQDQLDGEAFLVAECDGVESIFTFEMTGSLQGCWYTDEAVGVERPSGVYQETGRETFVGCLVEDGVELACGSFQTEYRFTGKFDAEGNEIHGRCQHPIVPGSGTGDFEGATGRVDFKDVVETGQFFFRGHINLA